MPTAAASHTHGAVRVKSNLPRGHGKPGSNLGSSSSKNAKSGAAANQQRECKCECGCVRDTASGLRKKVCAPRPAPKPARDPALAGCLTGTLTGTPNVQM